MGHSGLLRVFAGAAVATAYVASAQQIALPDGGSVVGTLETNVLGQSIQVFRGIPYAEPPVGERRWKLAVLKPLAGDVNATAFGNVCYGDGRVEGQSFLYPNSEDCLFLNVFAPAGVTSTSKLPVMVWIHGGSFVSGASNAFHGGNLIGASNNKIVFVSINYRLSVFGFLSNDALKNEGDGVNFGLRDQELAFKWVKQHIALFGGDPDDITAFGESAGAKSVFTHLISREGDQQIFHKAIAESGTYTTVHDMIPAATQNSVSSAIASAVGCGNATDSMALLSCLRSAPASAVWAAGGSLGWQPVVDGVFLLDTPIRRMLDGKMSPVPTIIGTNTDEGFIWTTSVRTAEAVMPYVRSRFAMPTEADVSRVDELYPAANFISPSHRVSEIYGDAIYACPSEFASLIDAARGLTTYRYRFNETLKVYGYPLAYHTAEIKYVFNNVTQLAKDPTTQAFVHDIQQYWTAFALTGSPNGDALGGDGSGSGSLSSSVGETAEETAGETTKPLTWPKYDVASRQQILLQSKGLELETTGAYMPLHAERCAFWLELEVRLALTLHEPTEIQSSEVSVDSAFAEYQRNLFQK